MVVDWSRKQKKKVETTGNFSSPGNGKQSVA